MSEIDKGELLFEAHVQVRRAREAHEGTQDIMVDAFLAEPGAGEKPRPSGRMHIESRHPKSTPGEPSAIARAFDALGPLFAQAVTTPGAPTVEVDESKLQELREQQTHEAVIESIARFTEAIAHLTNKLAGADNAAREEVLREFIIEVDKQDPRVTNAAICLLHEVGVLTTIEHAEALSRRS